MTHLHIALAIRVKVTATLATTHGQRGQRILWGPAAAEKRAATTSEQLALADASAGHALWRLHN
jgi:hypothetical protein